jgi:hypothetical protein
VNRPCASVLKGGDVSQAIVPGKSRRRRSRLGASFAALALVVGLAACSDDDDGADGGAEDATGSDVEEVTQAGSSNAAEVEALEAELESTQAELSTAQDDLATAEADLATAQEDLVAAQAALGTETGRADTAEAELAVLQADVDGFLANFPVTINASLEDYDLVGAYTLHLNEAFCDGISTCGQQRPDVRVDIIQGPNGLELQVPNVFTTGLFMIEGSLFGVTDSNLITPPCNGTPVNSQVSITMFADGKTIDIDGNQTLSGLGASLLVAVNPTASCGAGNVFFDATLTPV